MSDILNYKRHIKAQEKLDKQQFEQLKNDVKRVFDSESGIRVLHFIMSLCEVYSDCFTGNAQTYYLEGKRSIGLELLDLIMEVDPEIYIAVIRENMNE